MAYGYIRVSTLTQAREGESLEAQRHQVLSYAAAQGLELPEENLYVEAAPYRGITSASQRPRAFAKMSANPQKLRSFYRQLSVVSFRGGISSGTNR